MISERENQLFFKTRHIRNKNNPKTPKEIMSINYVTSCVIMKKSSCKYFLSATDQNIYK